MGKKGNSKQPPDDDDDPFQAMDFFASNEWGSSVQPGWGAPQEEDEDEGEGGREDEYERQRQWAAMNKAQHPKQKGGGQVVAQKGQQNQKARQNQDQNQKKGQKGQKNQKGQQSQNQEQQEPVWGIQSSNTDWSGVGAGDGGSNEWGVQQHQQRLPYPLDMSAGSDRGRANNSRQQWYGPKRGWTAAEHIKAAATGRIPSQTLLYAATGSPPATSVLDGGARDGPHAFVPIMDSGGTALELADRALYSHERPASQRIHWMFSPTKDACVSSLLDWIQAMSYALATVGLHNFLHTKQRGALMANAEFRHWRSQDEPAFDWVTFDDVVETHDKTLQESIAFYEPETQVLVFVFLLSRTGNSLAMWRRKLHVPIAVGDRNRTEITRLMNTLARHKYKVTVDELPSPPGPSGKQKKRWYNVRW